MGGSIKLCYGLGKAHPNTVKLMKKAYKHKCFGESTYLWLHNDFKKGYLFTKLASKPALPESFKTQSVLNDQNVNTA